MGCRAPATGCCRGQSHKPGNQSEGTEACEGLLQTMKQTKPLARETPGSGDCQELEGFTWEMDSCAHLISDEDPVANVTSCCWR